MGLKDIVEKSYGQVMDSFKKFTAKPYALTALYAGGGLLGSSSVGDLLPLAIFTGYGVVGDIIREGIIRKELHNWRNISSKLEKIIGNRGIFLLSEVVKEQHGLRGFPTHAEYIMKQQGTGIEDNGFLALLSLEYKNKEIKVLYKHNDKLSLRNGSRISRDLKNSGINFIPQPYEAYFSLDRIRGPLHSMHEEDFPLGKFYEYVKGDDLESILPSSIMIKPNEDRAKYGVEIFDLMQQIYDLNPENLGFISDKTFHIKHMDRIFDNLVDKEEPFLQILQHAYEELIEPLPKTLIHGDLHQGNIKIGDKNWIIDWDNAQLGIPYHDFFHYAIHTDLISDSNYEELRTIFLEKQEQRLGKIPDASLHYIETEMSLAMLNRYYTAVTEGKVREEFHDYLFHVCKRLEDISKKSWSKCLETSSANSEENCHYKKLYDSFIQNNYPNLDSIVFDEGRSISYAHSLNHQQIISLPGETGLKNYNNVVNKVESIIVTGERRKTLYTLNCIMPAFWIFGFTGYFAHANGFDVTDALSRVMDDGRGPIITSFFSMGLVSALSIYYSDKIFSAGAKATTFIGETAKSINDYFSSSS